MRLLVLLVAVLGSFVLVAMLVAPHQPTLRDWYLNNACPLLDRLSSDICAPIRREAGAKAAALSSTPSRNEALGFSPNVL
jgi:hypothetical protein